MVKREKQVVESPFLDNFLKAEAEARESIIEKTETQLHLAKQILRFEKMQKKVCKDSSLYAILERYKQQTFKLMEKE